MQTLLNEHEKALTHAISQDAADSMLPGDIAQELEYLKDFNSVQAEALPKTEQHTQQML